MTHMHPVLETAGDFVSVTLVDRRCRACDKPTEHRAQVWESLDGAYVDTQFTCLTCGAVNWVVGVDP